MVSEKQQTAGKAALKLLKAAILSNAEKAQEIFQDIDQYPDLIILKNVFESVASPTDFAQNLDQALSEIPELSESAIMVAEEFSSVALNQGNSEFIIQIHNTIRSNPDEYGIVEFLEKELPTNSHTVTLLSLSV